MDQNTLKRFLEKYAYSILACFLALKLVVVLLNFNFRVTDNDQAILWLACHDLSHGIFHTPFFYGCSYGSLLESLLAVPFYLAGLPLYYALPLSNFFWFFLAIVILGKHLEIKLKNSFSGLLFLLCFFFLKTEYYAIIFAAKGHMTGIFLVLPALILILRKDNRYLLIFTGFLLGLAFQFNPNALFLILISTLFLSKSIQLVQLVSGALASLVYHYFSGRFLTRINDGSLHGQWEIDFSFKEFMNNLEHVDTYLNNTTPIFITMGFLSLFIPVVICIKMIVKKDWHFLPALSYFLILLFSFGISKVTDGTTDVLFPFSRFYLTVAICNALLIVLLFQNAIQTKKIPLLISIIIPVILLVNIRLTFLSARELADSSGTTQSVKKSYMVDFLSNTEVLLENIKYSMAKNPLIVVTDYPLYAELLYIETLDMKDIVVYYHCNKKFYWKQSEIIPNKTYDIFICLKFDKLLAKKITEFQPFLQNRSPSPFFLFRETKNPGEIIESLLE